MIGRLVIEPTEAQIVKYIYESCLEGASPSEIAAALTEQGVKSPMGKDTWLPGTVRNILKGEGVYLMKHLKGGVKKGAFDDAEAQKRFDAWKNSKDAKISAVREGDAKAKKEAAAKELEAEKKMNEAIAKKVADKKAAAAAAEAEAKAAEEAPAEEAPAEA